jgi:hypothetical protein
MNVLSNRFLAAIRLCNGPLSIKTRLLMAWTEHLDSIDPDELPRQLRTDFIGLRKAMYARTPLPAESAPQASIRKMSVLDAAAHSDTIIALYTELVRNMSANTAPARTDEDVYSKDTALGREKDPAHQLN